MTDDSRNDTCWLYLVRHGATANNLAWPIVLQGRNLDAALAPEGRRQAERTGAFLAGVDLAAVYSSPLLRARETAEPIARPRGLPIQTVDDLTEVDVGRWEGLDWAEIERTDPEGHRGFLTDPSRHTYPGGERFQDVAARALPALERLAAAHLGQRIAVVAHNVVNRCTLARLMDVPLSQFRLVPQDNCGVNLLRYRAGRLKVVTVNAVMHLEGP